jgi:hypothetical protein
MWGNCGFPVPTDAGRSLTMANYLFGNYVLDVDERRLLRDNEEIRLRGKLFDTLRVLVENAGKLVRKDAFMESVWPDSVVEDNNLDYCSTRSSTSKPCHGTAIVSLRRLATPCVQRPYRLWQQEASPSLHSRDRT